MSSTEESSDDGSVNAGQFKIGPMPGQGFDLPKMEPIELGKMHTLEETDNNFSNWLIQITTRLAHHRLQYLIRSDLARPEPGAPAYEKWHFYSTTVGKWLLDSISEEMRNTLAMRKNRTPECYEPCYADQIMDDIDTLRGGGNRINQIQIDACALGNCRGNQFDTANDYLEAMLGRLSVLHDKDVMIPPVYVLCLLLNELKDELPEANFIYREIRDKEAGFVNERRFRRYCTGLKIGAIGAKAQIDAIKPAKQDAKKQHNRPRPWKSNRPGRGGNNDESQSQNQENSTHDTTRKRGAPPTGMDPSKWAEERRAATEQKDSGGRCTHCGRGYHNANDCFYLRDDHRQSWTPRSDVWNLREALENEDDESGTAASESLPHY